MAIHKVTNAELAVTDLEGAVGFHTDVLGMIELGRENGKVSLGCGLDTGADVVLVEGGSGVRRFSLKVDSSDDLHRYAKRLAAAGVASERCTDEIPGVLETLCFKMPSNHLMGLSVTNSPIYLHPSQGTPRKGIRALDSDHITLQTQEARPLINFLVDVLDFQISDIFAPAPGVIGAAWLRAGQLHHDIAIIATPEPGKSLHHYAFTAESFDQMKSAADQLASHGHKIEVPPGRHGVGGNICTFFWANGNRYELSAEMSRVAPGEPRTWDNFPKMFSLWGVLPPETFTQSS